MPRTNIEVQPLSPAIGAEIHGVDLSHELDDATFQDIHQAFLTPSCDLLARAADQPGGPDRVRQTFR